MKSSKKMKCKEKFRKNCNLQSYPPMFSHGSSDTLSSLAGLSHWVRKFYQYMDYYFFFEALSHLSLGGMGVMMRRMRRMMIVRMMELSRQRSSFLESWPHFHHCYYYYCYYYSGSYSLHPRRALSL